MSVYISPVSGRLWCYLAKQSFCYRGCWAAVVLMAESPESGESRVCGELRYLSYGQPEEKSREEKSNIYGFQLRLWNALFKRLLNSALGNLGDRDQWWCADGFDVISDRRL